MPELTLSAVIHQEADWFVAECPEIGTVSQVRTLEEALANLREATELYLEEVSDSALKIVTADELIDAMK